MCVCVCVRVRLSHTLTLCPHSRQPLQVSASRKSTRRRRCHQGHASIVAVLGGGSVFWARSLQTQSAVRFVPTNGLSRGGDCHRYQRFHAWVSVCVLMCVSVSHTQSHQPTQPLTHSTTYFHSHSHTHTDTTFTPLVTV